MWQCSYTTGQLTIATTILASTRTPRIPISYQVLLHPAISNFDADRQTRSEFQFFEGPILTVPFLKKSYAIYVPEAEDRDDELAAPVNITATHAKSQPPTLIINSSVDPLRDDGKTFGETLQTNGIDCAVLTTHGQVHDSEILEPTRGGPTPRAVVRMLAGSIVDAFEKKGADAGKTQVVGVEAKVEVNGNRETKEEVKTRKRRRTRELY
jgi:acetyl esterase